MTEYTRAEAATRAGVSLACLDQLVELGIVVPAGGARFSAGDARRAGMTRTLEAAGLPLESLATALDAVGDPSALGLTFAEIGPVELKGVAGVTDLFAAKLL